MDYFMNLFKDDLKIQELIGLNTELKALYLITALNKKQESSLVVTNSLYEANLLYQAIANHTDDVLFFPMDDFLTSEALAISPELKITRIETLLELLHDQPKIVITNLMGYLRYLPSPNNLKKHILNIKVGDEIDIRSMIQDCYQIGYEREVLVGKTGEIATRGYVIDIFPILFKNPIRIEFWGDTIESIREIDVDSQLTIKELKMVTIYPNNDFLSDNILPDDIKPIQRDLPQYTTVGNITDYMKHPTIYFNQYTELKIAYERLLDEMYQYSISINLPGNTTYMHDFLSLPTLNSKYFMQFDENLNQDYSKKVYQFKTLEHFHGNEEMIGKRLLQYLNEKYTVIIALSSRYQANKILETLKIEQLLLTNLNEIYQDRINIVIEPFIEGFILDRLIVISEKEIFNHQKQNIHYKTNFKLGTKIRDITKLEIGDYIVHSAYGIGKYAGIKTLTKNGLPKDYLMLEYKGDDKLYLPVEKIEFISKYMANGGGTPKLNKLGGTDWAKTKLRVQKKIEDIAGELLELYAAREASIGFSCIDDDQDQIAFEKEFPYQETVDQLKVIEEIKNDMQASRPMDRLLCGDVGFGKTEVAFRAIFKMIMSGKQAAFLCPTTILSNQHYQNAIERFQNFGVEIALINRFVTGKHLTTLKKDIESGKIDFVIGTHRILSSDIKFKDLGLLVIDEEQRFGVKHKEKIKHLKNNIDVLTLTATPIPRTLQLSLAGLRNLSLIETPPINRYPVQTYVMARNDTLLKDAIYKELSRHGQVFILFNHIDQMEIEANKLKRLVPEAKMITAHGQMKKEELEDIMMKFIHHEYDVLICTTIIETGIDIPNVNTLIIEDADRFGLSQLYQIRGRVGRSDKIAYCYLMYDPRKILSELATKRLNVIKDFTELGSGFHIAMRDLSIRGAGDILGREQAGFIDTIGIELFMQMLNEEVDRLKGKKKTLETKKDNSQPLLDVATAISDQYVADEELKIYIHKRINEIDSYEKLHQVKGELEDRFGKLDENMIIYMYEEWFEKLAAQLQITEVRETRNFINIVLPYEITELVNGELLFVMASDITRNFRFSMRGRQLIITLDTVRLEKHYIYYLIELMEVLQKAVQEEKNNLN